ncbi:MAG: DNA polymerase III subunit beta [Ruminococcaceae bacterium]|nr:DNA polymerase III subunit beta [Oscillospiraceae bacterium]
MKFYCSKEELLNAVNNVSKATNAQNGLEILRGIKLEANGEGLTLRATNLEISIMCKIDATVLQPGETVVDARMFSDIIRKSDDGAINIDINEKDEATIYTTKNKFNIAGMNAKEYPEFPILYNDRTLVFESKEFKDIVRDTVFAVAQDESRPILTGLKFEIYKNEMQLVSIDGYRMAIRKMPIKERNDEFSFIIKGRILNEVLKILRDDETEVEITLSQNNVVFKFDNCVIVACLMSGEYIKYEQFIPQSKEISIKMDRRLITQTVERASIIINYDDSRLPIILDIDGGVMSVDCVSKKGNFHEEIEIEQTATSLQIGLGSKFFLDALKASSGDDIIMEFSNAKSPLVIRPLEGDEYFYMVLPREFKR